MAEFFAAKVLFVVGDNPSMIHGKEFLVGYCNVLGRQAHVFRYPLIGLKLLATLSLEERMRVEDQTFLSLFNDATCGPQNALARLSRGEPYWCECADCYLVAGFGLTQEQACNALREFFMRRA